ncbi:caspase family protein [Streptomyces griseoruber]|uniref:caspase family protein n=1 Tax=Streptomyces griseoruber TaxID=1943 RepID=UPI0006E21AEB|nr:caspase family protein [Streptomyces griseoruber]
MTLRALLIGAQTFGLKGVHADIERMRQVLTGRGFTDLDIRTGQHASYEGIREGFARLRDRTVSGDGVVVHYSGHGGLTDDLQYLVPFDLAESTAADFRGYLAEELTAELAALAERTPNITCILDCCHSGGAVREAACTSGRWTLKSVLLPRVPLDAARTRAEALTRRDEPLVPNVVRLAACAQHGAAWEWEPEPGAGLQGVFTAALADLLDATAGRRVPWSVLVARARDRIAQQRMRQRPDAGGPSGRLPFSLEESAEPDRLPLLRSEGRFRIPGGALFGLHPPDTVALVFPVGAPEEEGGDISLAAAVEEMRGGDALLRVTESGDGAATAEELRTAPLPPGSHALAIEVHDRRNVLIEAPRPFADELRGELVRSPRLTETTTAVDAFAVVRMRAGAPEVLGPGGQVLRRPGAPSLAGAARVAELLEELARGDRLRRMGDPEGAARLHAAVDVLIEVPEPPAPGQPRHPLRNGGAWRPLRPVGERLYDGDGYRVRVTNSAGTRVYFWVVGVGLSGRTTLVTNHQPSGCPVEPDRDHVTQPISLYWPPDVPQEGGSRAETVLVIVGDRPMDLSGLTSRETRTPAGARGALAQLLREVRDGVRDQRMTVGDEFRYRVWTVDAEALPHAERPGNPGGPGSREAGG